MSRLILLIFLLIDTLVGKAQIVGNRANKYAVENSIDTFLIYTFPCSDGISVDSCHLDDPHFLIWKKVEVSF